MKKKQKGNINKKKGTITRNKLDQNKPQMVNKTIPHNSK